MPSLSLEITIPLGEDATVQFTATIGDLDQLTPAQRQVLADTTHEFAEFAAATIAPAAIVAPIGAVPAAVHDPSATVLDGVRGSRRNP